MDLKGKKVYISGKITGENGYIYRFAEAEHKLTKLGADAVNPARVNAELPRDTDYRQYMRMCLVMLFDCDAILLLDNWKDSPGATAELYMARALGMDVYFDGREAIEEDLPLGDGEQAAEEEITSGGVKLNMQTWELEGTHGGKKREGGAKNNDRPESGIGGRLREIAGYYGLECQWNKTVEELAELIRAMARNDSVNVMEEIADVEIMLYQLKYLTGMSEGVAHIKDKKVARTLNAIAAMRMFRDGTGEDGDDT